MADIDLEEQYITNSKHFLENSILSRDSSKLPEGLLLAKLYLDKIGLGIDEFLKTSNKGLNSEDIKAKQMLIGVPIDTLALITLTTIIDGIKKAFNNGITVTALGHKLKSALAVDNMCRKVTKDYPTLDRYIDEVYKSRSKAYKRTIKNSILRNKEALAEGLNKTTLKMASHLISIVTAKTDLIILKNVREKGKTIATIFFTEQVQRLIHQTRNSLLQQFITYPVSPNNENNNWNGSNFFGGFKRQELQVPMIKAYGRTRKELKEIFKKDDNVLKKIAEPLNALGGTAWVLNKKIVDVIKTIVDNKMIDYTQQFKYIADVPYMDIINIDDLIKKEDFGVVDDRGMFSDPKDYGKYSIAYEQTLAMLQSNNSKALTLRLVLKECENYSVLDKFFFTYQYDFRSRIYPVQNHLHTQGTDTMKSVMMFKQGYPIPDKETERWFYIYGANQYGYDKELYDERIAKIKEIPYREYAKDPFSNLGWTEADSPFQFLAWCYEVVAYEDNPTEFLSHLPIGLDATCSGIQIYSGLLLDGEGALAVNVIGKIRQDIYGKVATKVNQYLKEGDYNKFIEYTTADGTTHRENIEHIANSLVVDRSLTKRNTMTQPYSVTKFGMYEQLKEELQSQVANKKLFLADDVWKVAKFLVTLNDRAIQEVVKGARIGQEFLKEVTKDLVKGGEYVRYFTPYRDFPVIQKIYKEKVNRVYTQLGYLSLRSETDVIDSRKMVSGIAPNYIHSLDATLLAMVLMRLYNDYGIRDFHFIHDQYGVPITYVPILVKVIKECYVELFGINPLQHTLAQLYKGEPKDVTEVMLNTFDLKEVLDSEYIFS